MFFDSHTHLNLAAFDKDRKEVIKNILFQDIFIINVGTCYGTSKKAIEISKQYKNCWATVGLHPSHTIPTKIDRSELGINNGANISEPETFNERFEDLLKEPFDFAQGRPKVVAVGECGLDYSYLKDFSEEEQIKYKKIEEEEFRKQIRIAKEYNLPLILHLRNLYKKALEILQEETFNGQLVFHFFTGSLEDSKLILQNPNYFIGFSGVITYGNKLDEVIRGVPLGRILIETDAPYVAPIPYRGKRNEPLYVKEVVKKIAEIKNLPLKEVEKATFENALRFFGIQLKEEKEDLILRN